MIRGLVSLFLALGLMAVQAQAEDLEPRDLVVDEIQCEGNSTTDCDLIRREIYLTPGQKVDEDEIANARIRLQLSGLFKTVSLRLEKGAVRGHVQLVAEVEEASPIFSETSFSFSGDKYGPDGLLIGASLEYKLGTRNLFGKGKILQATVQPLGLLNSTRTALGTLEYIDPHLFGEKKYFFSDKLSYESVNERLPSGSFSWPRDAYWNEFTLGRRFFDFSYITITQGYSHSNRLTRETDAAPIRKTEEFRNWFLAAYGWNSEDDPYFVTQGSKVEVGIWTQSIQFWPEYKLDIEKTWSLGEKQYLVLHNSDSWDPDHRVNSITTRTGIEYAIQIRRLGSERGITDSRLSFQPFFKVEDSSYTRPWRTGGAEVGWTFMSTSLGLVKLTGTYWADR